MFLRMLLRPLRPKDIPAAANLIGQNFNAEYKRLGTKELRYMFGKGPIKPYYCAVVEKGELLGFGGYIQSWMDYEVYELFWINVRKDVQGQGIGKAIVNHLITKIRARKPLLILLSTDKPKYYARWKFKKLFSKSDGGYVKMALQIKNKSKL